MNNSSVSSCSHCQKFGPCGQAIIENAREQFRRFARGLAGAQLAVTAAETRAERVAYSDLVRFAARLGGSALPSADSVSECFQSEFCRNARRMGFDGPDSLALWRFLPASSIDSFLAAHAGSTPRQRTLLAAIVDQVMEFRVFDRARVVAAFCGDTPEAQKEGARAFCRDRLHLDAEHPDFEEEVFLKGTVNALRAMFTSAVRHANLLGSPGFVLDNAGVAWVADATDATEAAHGPATPAPPPAPPLPPPRLVWQAPRRSRSGRR